MIDCKKYDKAKSFAEAKHKGQFRKGGLPYITHPIAVAEKLKNLGYGEDYVIAGLFHDLLEDTDATEKEIEEIGGKEVLKVVKLLTKTDGYVMDEYVSAIKKHPIAKVVKAMDRLHNLECAIACDQSFRKRYVIETIDYYLDFDEQILKAVQVLSNTLEEPIEIELKRSKKEEDKCKY